MCQRGISPVAATIQQIADFLVYLRREKLLSLSAVKGYRSALNSVFALRGMDLSASRELSMLMRGFKKSLSPQEVRPPEWDVTLVLSYLRGAPFEPLRQASLRDVTLKTLFLLALASAKRIGELHGFSHEVRHSRGWNSLTFSFVPDFVAKTQDPSVFDPRFESFTIPSLRDFTDGDQDEMLLCPVRAVREYLRRTRECRPQLPRLFLSTGSRRKMVSRNTISFWLREVIRKAYVSSGVDLPPRIRSHELRAIAPSVAFRRNFRSGTGNEGWSVVAADHLHLILPPGCHPPFRPGSFLPRSGGGCSAGAHNHEPVHNSIPSWYDLACLRI